MAGRRQRSVHRAMGHSGNDWTLLSDSPETTLSIGRALGRSVEPGLVIALIGPLGAGKTLLVRGIADGLDIADSRLVSSPTFLLIHQYAARLPIYHLDVYRLATPDEFVALGPDEYWEGDGVCLVEWADRVRRYLPDDRLDIQFAISGTTYRHLDLRAIGDQPTRVLARLKQMLAAKPVSQLES